MEREGQFNLQRKFLTRARELFSNSMSEVPKAREEKRNSVSKCLSTGYRTAMPFSWGGKSCIYIEGPQGKKNVPEVEERRKKHPHSKPAG